MAQKTKLFLFLILVLSAIGIADSIHLLEIKYVLEEETVNCDVNEKFSCTNVNMTPQSTVSGFPTAGIGLLGYTLLGVMSLLLWNKKSLRKKLFFEKIFNNTVTPFTLLLVATAGLAIQVYFTHVEFFVLEQSCIFCLVSQALVLGIAVLAYVNFKK